jgi:anthrone oxygenase-like protein
MAALAKFIAILSGAIFTGAALYISVVEHPARMAAGSGVALSQFRQMYPRAAPLQASAAGICGLAGVIAALMSRQVGWLIGGLMVASAIPFTLLVMLSTNHRLLASDSPGEDEAARLLVSWGKMHWVRTVASVCGLLLMLGTAFLGLR